MTFDQWLQKQGFTAGELTEHQEGVLRAMYGSGMTGPADPGAPEARNRRWPKYRLATPRGARLMANMQVAAGAQLRMIGEPEDLTITAAAKGADGEGKGDEKLPTFNMTAYTGGAMWLMGWMYPVIVDLKGLRAGKRARPVLRDHDRGQVVGHTETIEIGDSRLRVAGVISGTSEAALEIISTSKNKFPWRASIGARADKMAFIEAGKTAAANGKEFNGPVYIARKATLGEISFVALDADGNTTVKVAATGSRRIEEHEMTFEKWIKAQGFGEPDELTDQQRTSLEAMWKLQQEPEGDPEPKDKDKATPKKKIEAQEPPAKEPTATEPAKTEAEIRAEAAGVERQRICNIEAACKGFDGEEIDTLKTKAIKGEIDLEAFQTKMLDHLREDRPKAPAIGSGQPKPDQKILLAAAYMGGGLEEKQILDACGEPAMEAAHRLRGMGLQEFCATAAGLEGIELGRYRTDPDKWLNAAFSTLSVPGILSNVANKFLLAGFTAVEAVWQEIAAVRSVKDFKANTSYRMTGDMKFIEVGPTGELEHGQIDEEEFVNQAKTYGRMFVITRRHIIDDDLGAMTVIPRRIGRGGALQLNLVFWTAFLNNSALFTTLLKNYKTGAGTALSINALTTAEQMFADQTDADDNPLGLAPAKLLTPTALSVTAAQIMRSTELRDTTASTKAGTINPHAGKFTPVTSAYLSKSTISGYSSAAWYLLANPQDLATIEVCFLNGIQRPTVERAVADFNVLGVQFRGFFDFGVALQEYRAGVKMRGT